MNKPITFLLLSILLFSSCSKSNEIQFCEGVSPDGDGVNCGTEFTSGKLTAIVNADKPFGSDTIDVQIYEASKGHAEKLESLSVKVKELDTKANVTLSLDTEGAYLVKAFVKDEAVSKGTIKITDQ